MFRKTIFWTKVFYEKSFFAKKVFQNCENEKRRKRFFRFFATMKNGEKLNLETPRKRKTAKTQKNVFVRPLGKVPLLANPLLAKTWPRTVVGQLFPEKKFIFPKGLLTFVGQKLANNGYWPTKSQKKNWPATVLYLYSGLD